MSLLINALLNFLRFLRNVHRALRRSPDFVWIPVTGALPELKPSLVSSPTVVCVA
jgi:hypothetical protein